MVLLRVGDGRLVHLQTECEVPGVPPRPSASEVIGP